MLLYPISTLAKTFSVNSTLPVSLIPMATSDDVQNIAYRSDYNFLFGEYRRQPMKLIFRHLIFLYHPLEFLPFFPALFVSTVFLSLTLSSYLPKVWCSSKTMALEIPAALASRAPRFGRRLESILKAHSVAGDFDALKSAASSSGLLSPTIFHHVI